MEAKSIFKRIQEEKLSIISRIFNMLVLVYPIKNKFVEMGCQYNIDCDKPQMAKPQE